MSEPVTLMPFRLILPGEAQPGVPIRDFRPNVTPADAPSSEDGKKTSDKEVPSNESEGGGEDDDPKGDTVMVSVDSSKKTDSSQKDAVQSPEEKSANVDTGASVFKPVVPSPPTSSSETKDG